jgi:hypothetical protein
MSRAPSPEACPSLEALRHTQDALQALLDRHNPGEKLQEVITNAPQKIPAHCLETIEQAGPALHSFFTAACHIFREAAWVRPLIEKRYHPNYRRLNDAQPEAIPLNPRPDIVPDANWNPKFVELEITVGGRSGAALQSQVFGLPREKTSVHLYAEMLRRRGLADRPIALLSAFHEHWQELGHDAVCFASLLREAGANVEAVTDEDLPYLSYRDGRLRCLRPGHTFEFTHFDRFIDLFEIAEVCHAGMRPLLEAYLDGQAIDMNTCKQFLDEKLWMALFWDPRLADPWRRLMSEEHHAVLERILPFTTFVTSEAQIRLPDGERVPLDRLHEVPNDRRRFVTKESGTSETAAGAQSFVVLRESSAAQVNEHLQTLIHIGPPSIVQELVESARVDFYAIDPDTRERLHRRDARVKMSAFYIDGQLGDLLFVSSNKQYAVHNEDYLESVVAR